MRSSRQTVQAKYGGMLTWELYNWQYYARRGGRRPVWVIHDGPPFASGKAHLGHLYNKTLKDIINRYKLLRGYRVHFIPGFDCHGTNIEDAALAAELKSGAGKVRELDLKLEKVAKKEEKMSESEKEAVKRRYIIREYVKRSALSQMQDYNKWGIMTDWRYSYLTMSNFIVDLISYRP
jgi:isoleucyl-tRNA synthetase